MANGPSARPEVKPPKALQADLSFVKEVTGLVFSPSPPNRRDTSRKGALASLLKESRRPKALENIFADYGEIVLEQDSILYRMRTGLTVSALRENGQAY